MEKISASVRRVEQELKSAGKANYIDDITMPDMLHAAMVRSTKARAKINGITLPELPEGYTAVDYRDVPGKNEVHIVKDDTPVFAEETVEFIGDPILMIVGPDEKTVRRLAQQTVVDYEELTPVLNVHDSETVFFHESLNKGDVDQAMVTADDIYTETFRTAMQEQAYLETNGMIAYPENGGMTVTGSLQCPYYVKNALKQALGSEDVRVVHQYTGGAFGGKEDYPSVVACQAAVAAQKTGKPVKYVLTREEDLAFTPKRHPAEITYQAAIKNGKITGVDITLTYDAGAYTTLSLVVLQRGTICANGVYNFENLRAVGDSYKTNTCPGGAFRGFGAPQVFFSVETFMDHLADHLGRNRLDFKLEYLVKQGDQTSTQGRFHQPVVVPQMVEKLDKMSEFKKKRALYSKPQTGRYRRGIGFSQIFHGCGFTGNGERDLIKAVCGLRKSADGRVLILAANTEMGQGIITTFSKIVAQTLDIPLDQIDYPKPDTNVMPDSGPTVASRSIMMVGNLLEKAAKKLKENWQDGVEQEFIERYHHPEFLIPFDAENFLGDAYPAYSWSVNAIEVEVDTLTGQVKTLHADGVYDIGVPIDEVISAGQMEGGISQGIGYASSEVIGYDARGRIRNNHFSDYIIPTSADIGEINVDFVNNPYEFGPYGAKGAGEMPIVGPAPAYIDALEQALGTNIRHIPFTQEDVMRVLKEEEQL